MEETGWKLVHGDVFRPPKHTKTLASLLGAGMQIFFMALITICKTASLMNPIYKKTDILKRKKSLFLKDVEYRNSFYILFSWIVIIEMKT